MAQSHLKMKNHLHGCSSAFGHTTYDTIAAGPGFCSDNPFGTISSGKAGCLPLQSVKETKKRYEQSGHQRDEPPKRGQFGKAVATLRINTYTRKCLQSLIGKLSDITMMNSIAPSESFRFADAFNPSESACASPNLHRFRHNRRDNRTVVQCDISGISSCCYKHCF